MEPWTFYISPFRPKFGPWDPQPPIYALLHFPLIYVTRLIYRAILFLRPLPSIDSAHPIRVVTISDTHDNTWPDVPEGDLLIHAGDLTRAGKSGTLQAQINWLNSLPHPHKIAIAGNHDTYLDPRSRVTLAEEDRADLEWGDIHYLQHSKVELAFPNHGGRKLKIYAAPQIPANFGPPPSDWAFTYLAKDDAWTDTIPSDIDILVTHGPPQWHLDIYGLGCKWLLSECWRVKPKLHVFGHVHAGRGSESVFWDQCQISYEKLCTRSKGAGIWSLARVSNWLDLIKMCLYGLQSIVWSRLWGGKVDGTVQINTALMWRSTGRLGNAPQVVYV